MRSLATGLATAYALAWCCLAPMLEYCTCVHAETGYAVAGHQSCDAKSHGHAHLNPDGERDGNPHGNRDGDPVPADQYLSGAAPPSHPAPSYVAPMPRGPEREGAAIRREPNRRSTGPPGSVRAALASTVLLI